MKSTTILSLLLLATVTTTANAQNLVWTVGLPGDGWPQDLGFEGGPETVFVQEAGVNNLPGDPDSPVANQQSDDDYYFAGVYDIVLDNGDYDPVGEVEFNEEGAERAFAATDNSLRYHFNLPDSLGNLPFTVQWDANNLHEAAENPDPRYGVEVYFNGNLIAEETIIEPDDFGIIQETAPFTLGDVDGELGEGYDNYVELRGINYNAEGGGNWMGVDHVSLHQQDATFCTPESQGDLDGNGRVDFADFLTLSANFGKDVGSHVEGDINCSGTVDFADFLALSASFGTEVGGAKAVPEPAARGLLLFSILLLAIRRKR